MISDTRGNLDANLKSQLSAELLLMPMTWPNLNSNSGDTIDKIAQMNVSEKYSNQEIFNSSENSIRKYLGLILITYLRWREQQQKMWGIIFHGYQDMSQGKGNISVRCQMRGKIYKRPIQRGANAKIRHTHTYKG